MNQVLREIVDTIDAAEGKPDYLDTLFGNRKVDALAGHSVVIFGAGSLGREMCATLRHHAVQPLAYCDNGAGKAGKIIDGLPVISFDELLRGHRDSLIVIAVLKHRAALTQQLIDAGVAAANVACTDEASDFIYMYSMVGTQVLFTSHQIESRPGSHLDYLIRHQNKISLAHELLHDERSKSLLVAKLALMASDQSFHLFSDFIRNFSEPYRDFGLAGYDGTPEDHYYFNNDLLSIDAGEIYVDVGAYDGDTIETFAAACRRRGVEYVRIFAFEPDAACHTKLVAMSGAYRNVSCHRLGLWSKSTTLRFSSSENAIHDQAAFIADAGDVEIEVVSLDDFLKGEKVTLIKADPGGNVIPEVLRGAAETIRKHRPKLALGAYHGADSIFAIPLLVHELYPGYQISLRHNTYHLCDTDLLALPSVPTRP